VNKRIRILCVLTALIISMCVFTLTANATGEVVVPDPNVPAEIPTSSPPAEPEVPAPTEAPVIEPEPATQAPDNNYDDTYVEPTVDPNAGYIEEPTSGGYVDSYTNEDGYYYYDEDEMVNNLEDTAGNVSDYTDLYDTSDLNKEELKESKWDDIVLDTSKADGDAADFSAIKENKETDDNGQWIIYTGLILIGLSLLGILYFIIATATYKKKLKALKLREQRQRRREQERPRDDYGDFSDYPTQSDYNRHYQRNRYSQSNTPYSQRKRQKADTAEIDLPRRYVSRH